MTALQPYPAYKDSGVEWLGEVPEHWEVRRLRTLSQDPIANGVGESAHPFRSDWPRYVRITDIAGPTSLHDATAASLPPERATGAMLARGDLVFAAVGATYGKSFLYLGESDFACFAGYLVRLRPKSGVSPSFLSYWAQARPYWEQVHRSVIQATIQNLSASRYKRFMIGLPPLPEQRAIARFLDDADRRVRRYIRAKERLIELLEEEKQTIIHEAVTGQIDVRTGQPYPAYKDSGVEWLGKVPEHWELSRVKTEFHCLNRHRVPLSGTQRGAMKRREYNYYGASGVIDKVDSYLFDDELLLIAEDGANLVLRNLPLAIVAQGKFWVNNHAHILKPKRGHIDFLAHLMESLNYSPWISGAAQPKLTQDRIMSITIAVPPRWEQDQIVACLAGETVEMDAALRQIRRQIALLREYRTRLIADVVTGKLDVRDAAAELPSQGDLVADRDGIAAEYGADVTNADAEPA